MSEHSPTTTLVKDHTCYDGQFAMIFSFPRFEGDGNKRDGNHFSRPPDSWQLRAPQQHGECCQRVARRSNVLYRGPVLGSHARVVWEGREEGPRWVREESGGAKEGLG